MNIFEVINSGSKRLKMKNILSHRLDSEILMSKVLKKRREDILINFQKSLSKNEVKEFNALIKRRILREPIAYITGEKEFWSKSFLINNNTLIPRPETELMIEQLIKIYKLKKIFILDIGTGSGCILISLLIELKNSSGVGVDISKSALKIAEKNSMRNKVIERSKFLIKSIDSHFNKKFDLIVSNPPYIKRTDLKKLDDDIKKYEPKIALDGGNDGLDVIKKVIYKSKNILKVNGRLALEISGEHKFKVSEMLIKNNFRIEYIIKDYTGINRIIISQKIK